MTADFQILERELQYQFNDVSLLRLALTHRSFSTANNERLEFLGDGLLNSTIAQKLYFQFPDENEGILSRLRASLVRGTMLAKIARRFDLGNYLIMGAGELKSGGSQRESILADAVEGIIGAIFVDSNITQSQQFIERIYQHELSTLSVDKYLKDPKTRLQELLQARQLPLPAYTIVDVGGLSHQQKFTVSCDTALLKNSPEATGLSRREAEQKAAEKVLAMVEETST